MIKRFQILVALIFVFIFAVSISACASNSRRSVNRGGVRTIMEKGANRVYRRHGNYSLQTPGVTTAQAAGANEERSKKIADAVTKLDAIKSASVVITGNTAIVGVQTDSGYDDAELIDIKRIVEEQVKAADQGIDHVSVTTAIDLVGRINRMPDAGSGEDPPLAGPGDFVPRG